MENTKKQTLTIPTAIVAAGFLIMVGLLLTGGGSKVLKEKTLSEQVGVNKEELAKCIKNTDTTALGQKIQTSVESAMKGEDGIGTPFIIIIGANGVRSKINGIVPYEQVEKVINEVIAGKITTPYTGEVPPINETDHIKGDPTKAQVTIIEYSDFECPICARFHPTLEKIVSESNGNIAWVYRQFPLTGIHPTAWAKTVASECIAQIKGNDAFWKYGNLLFKLVTPVEDPIIKQL